MEKENRKIEVDGKETEEWRDELVEMFLKGIFEILTKEEILQIAGVKKPKDVLENKT